MLFLLVALLAAQDPPPAPEAGGNIGLGPLHVSTLSPFQALRSGFVTRTPSELPRGSLEIRATETWANMWAFNEDDWLLDYEVLRSSLTVRYALTDSTRLEFEVEDSVRFGGVMDPLIDRVHELVGAETRHREDFPQNDFGFELDGRGERPSVALSNRDRGSFNEVLLAAVEHLISEGGAVAPALSCSMSLRTDLGPNEDLRGGTPLDAAASFSAAKRAGDVHFYASVGLAWFGNEEFRGVRLRPIVADLLLAAEWRVGQDVSLVLQYLLTQGAAEHWRDFSDPSNEVLLGVKARLGGGAVLEAGLIENFLLPNNSPDFGVHVGLSLRR